MTAELQRLMEAWEQGHPYAVGAPPAQHVGSVQPCGSQEVSEGEGWPEREVGAAESSQTHKRLRIKSPLAGLSTGAGEGSGCIRASSPPARPTSNHSDAGTAACVAQKWQVQAGLRAGEHAFAKGARFSCCPEGHGLTEVAVDDGTGGCSVCTYTGWLLPITFTGPEEDRIYRLEQPFHRPEVWACSACGYILCDECLLACIWYAIVSGGYLDGHVLARLCRFYIDEPRQDVHELEA